MKDGKRYCLECLEPTETSFGDRIIPGYDPENVSGNHIIPLFDPAPDDNQ